MEPVIFTDHHTATKAREKLDAYISGAQFRAESVISKIMTDVPSDKIVAGHAMKFSPTASGVEYLPPSGTVETIHDNALTQLSDRMSLPMGFVRHMQETAANVSREQAQELARASIRGIQVTDATPRNWASELLATTLNEHAQNALLGERLLTRSGSNGQLRAVLSDKFRRIDCRPSLDAALTMATKYGAVVTDAIASDVRSSVRMILPTVREISQGEFVVLGLSWSNSDYGRGANSMSMFALRLWCLNGAMLEQAIRQIHLGARLSSDIEYSARTLAYDTRANVSAIADTTRALLNPARVDETVALLTKAANERIDPKTKLADIRKRFGKGLSEKVAEAYAMPDVEELPPGNTAWRWSNAISWVAKQKDTTADMRLDLEKAAGDALAV